MNEYRHHVSGFFAHRNQAEAAFDRLVERGMPSEQLQLFDAESGPAVTEIKGKDSTLLTNVLVDGAIGTAVGGGIGALAQLAIVAANVSLFVASPLVAPLVMLGWGASLGAFVGAAAGANAGFGHKEGWLADLIRDAIASGQVVLVAETRTEQETVVARDVIATSVGDVKDVAMTV